MVIFLSAGLAAPSPGDLGNLIAVAGLLITLCIIDLEHRRLPNVLVAALALTLAVWRWRHGGGDLAAGAAIAAGVLAVALSVGALSRYRLLGAGDAKLMAAAAIGLPWWQFVVFIGAAGGLGTVLVLSWQARGRGRKHPFGPALAAALWLCLLWPDLSAGFAA